MRGRGPRTVALACATVLAAAVTAFAQFGQWGGIAEGPGVPVRTPPDELQRWRVLGLQADVHERLPRGARHGMGHGLSVRGHQPDDPRIGADQDADQPGSARATRTTGSSRPPIPRSSRCPYVMAADVGTLEFSPEEVKGMRDYLLKGGFLWVDDFWGTLAWRQWSAEIRRVLPEYQDHRHPDGPSGAPHAVRPARPSRR